MTIADGVDSSLRTVIAVRGSAPATPVRVSESSATTNEKGGPAKGRPSFAQRRASRYST
jgi:hypothetical protein